MDFKFADIGEGIHEGVILKWFFEVGDKVEEGETIVLIETDKVNAEIPSPETGILQKRGAEVGETIHVGETLAIIGDQASEDKNEDKTDEKSDNQQTETAKNDKNAGDKNTKQDSASVVGAIESSDDVLEASNEHLDQEDSPQKNQRILATPVARKMAKDLSVDLQSLKGSGPQGRIMKEDIQKASKTTQPSQSNVPSSEQRVRREKVTKLRKTIVEAMNRSNQLIPATTVMDTFDVTELAEFRQEQREKTDTFGVKLTYLPLIIKAIVLTLKAYPIFNASFDHDQDEIIYKEYYNIGIAVDTPDGLIVPNIKDADKKSVLELAKEIKDLAEKARSRTIKLDDLQDTTFSITNYGAFGSKLGTPVINHPEVAIFGMGAITKQPAVINDEIVARDLFPVSLTIDHRVIDGGDAGRFMVQLREHLEDPIKLLLS